MSENQKAFFILKDGSIASTVDANKNTFYLSGHMENGQFVLDEKRVQGNGQFAKSGRPGWLEINNGEFYSQETAKAVVSPYVKGYMTDEGFTPSSDRVF